MQTPQSTHDTNNHHRLSFSRHSLAVLVILGGLGLAGCAGTQSQRANSNGKPGANAPHEERNPSQHPEQFR